MEKINIAKFREMFLNAKFLFCVLETSMFYKIQTTTNHPFKVIFSCGEDRIVVSGIQNINVDNDKNLLQFETENYLTGVRDTYNFKIIKNF